MQDERTTSSRGALMARLAALGIDATVEEHDAVFTVEEARAARAGAHVAGHTKNLFLKDKKGALFLVTVREEADVDLKTLHKRLGSARFSFGKADLLEEVLGVQPGSVTPLAVMNDEAGRVRLVLDTALMALDRIHVHPLENTATLSLAPTDLVAFARDVGHDPLLLDLETPLEA